MFHFGPSQLPPSGILNGRAGIGGWGEVKATESEGSVGGVLRLNQWSQAGAAEGDLPRPPASHLFNLLLLEP